jgi:spore maturation protein CgeB
MPQIKSRVFEAAFNRSLILCFRDHWNVIEYFFEPDKEFIYFDNIHDLEDKIKYILQHYDFYQDIIDNAYNKAINNYTVDHFVEKYLEPI